MGESVKLKKFRNSGPSRSMWALWKTTVEDSSESNFYWTWRLLPDSGPRRLTRDSRRPSAYWTSDPRNVRNTDGTENKTWLQPIELNHSEAQTVVYYNSLAYKLQGSVHRLWKTSASHLPLLDKHSVKKRLKTKGVRREPFFLFIYLFLNLRK